MSIEAQKRIANRILEAIDDKSGQTAIAGGAPRDWYLGNIADDIDVFICGVEEGLVETYKVQTEEDLGVSLQPLTEKQYDGSRFTGYEYVDESEGFEQKVQILFHHKDLHTTVKEFPVNVSRIWWDGEYHTHWTFSLWTNYSALVVDETVDNHRYIDKIYDKMGMPRWYVGLSGFLRCYGIEAKRQREGGGFVAAPLF